MTGENDSVRSFAPRSLIRHVTGRQLAVDIVLAVLFLFLFGFVALEPNAPIAATLTVGALMAGALAVRRLSPGLALLIAWVGALSQMLLGIAPTPSSLAIFGVVYVTAAYGTRAIMWAGFVSAVFGALVAAVYLAFSTGWLDPSGPDLLRSLAVGGSWFIALAFALVLSWTIGALVRSSLATRATRIAQERAEAETAAEQERGRIARDMHDVVAHSLAVVVAQADGARYAADADPQVAKDALGTISQTARSALADVRLLLAQLRHRQVDGPQPTLADLEALFAQVGAAGVELRVDIDPTPPGEAPTAVQLAVYRIVQEALTNALRHGDGGVVDIRMQWRASEVTIDVRNGIASDGARGPGAQAPAIGATQTTGHGLIGMRERAQLVGGEFRAGPDGRIFIVHATLPISGYGVAA